MQLFGIEIDSLDMAGAAARVLELAKDPGGGPCRYVVTPSVDHVVLLSQRADLMAAYRDAALVLADGAPILWTSWLVGKPLPGRVAGSDLASAVFWAASPAAPLTVFLLGASPGVAERAKVRVEREYSNVRVVGTYSPPLGTEKDPAENAQALAAVASAKPELLVVGLGAPKQELWVQQHQHQIRARVALCIGATIDFLAGAKLRAPRWMQTLGVEWLFRTLQEPERPGKRYFQDGVRSPPLVFKEVRSAWRRRPNRAPPVAG
jgi:N-acetylglucosaminyldiphosphoundecaprenol N-acetyl-beta-D-mannosaminyltransferase